MPHFKTTGADDLYHVERSFIEKQNKIEGWFREEFHNQPVLLSTSVDIRNAGYKIAPVDTNLFPAGFNNLNPEFYPLCIQSFQSIMERQFPHCQRIIIIPESHTRNPFYYESLYTLFEIILKAGFDVRVAMLITLKTPKEITLSSGGALTLYSLRREGDTLFSDDFEPDLVLLNNDLTEGVPSILKGITQPITPLPKLGWAHRNKSSHFRYYQNVCDKFSQSIGIDSWEISPLFEDCGDINFITGTSDTCLIEQTEKLFEQIRLKYLEYKIDDPPFVVIKAEQGTYGMAVMMVKSVNELKTLNRKQRQNMGKIKGGQSVTRVIIQEGVYTRETAGDKQSVAEPVIYTMGQHVIGGFYRVHTQKGPQENLNAPGMHFEPLAFEACCNEPDERLSPHATPNRFYAYSVIARLALLATTLEYKAIGTTINDL